MIRTFVRASWRWANAFPKPELSRAGRRWRNALFRIDICSNESVTWGGACRWVLRRA